MTSFTLNLISVKVSFNDIFKKTLNITPVNITSFTVVQSNWQIETLFPENKLFTQNLTIHKQEYILFSDPQFSEP